MIDQKSKHELIARWLLVLSVLTFIELILWMVGTPTITAMKDWLNVIWGASIMAVLININGSPD